MSGSSGGNIGGGIGGGMGGLGGGKSQVTCETLILRTILNSPNPDVLSHLNRNDVLNIVIQGTSLIAVTSQGQTAGSITSPRMAKILECIGQGFRYVAIVKEINGGHCEVEVRPRS